MAAAAIGTMALSDLLSVLVGNSRSSLFFQMAQNTRGIYLVAVVIFLVASTPSWVPRLVYFGSPFHHGYLENYMWVDTYKEGHVGESYATYTWRDYFAHHQVRDMFPVYSMVCATSIFVSRL